MNDPRFAARMLAALAALAVLASPLEAAGQARKTPRASSGPAAAPKRPALDVPLPPPPAPRAPPAEAPPAPGASAVTDPARRAPRAGWLGLAAGPFAALDRGRSFSVAVDYGVGMTPAS